MLVKYVVDQSGGRVPIHSLAVSHVCTATCRSNSALMLQLIPQYKKANQLSSISWTACTLIRLVIWRQHMEPHHHHRLSPSPQVAVTRPRG